MNRCHRLSPTAHRPDHPCHCDLYPDGCSGQVTGVAPCDAAGGVGALYRAKCHCGAVAAAPWVSPLAGAASLVAGLADAVSVWRVVAVTHVSCKVIHAAFDLKAVAWKLVEWSVKDTSVMESQAECHRSRISGVSLNHTGFDQRNKFIRDGKTEWRCP